MVLGEAKIYLKVSYTSSRKRPLRQYRLSSNSRMQHLYWVEVIANDTLRSLLYRLECCALTPLTLTFIIVRT
jgi:hypothetical protein